MKKLSPVEIVMSVFFVAATATVMSALTPATTKHVDVYVHRDASGKLVADILKGARPASWHTTSQYVTKVKKDGTINGPFRPRFERDVTVQDAEGQDVQVTAKIEPLVLSR